MIFQVFFPPRTVEVDATDAMEALHLAVAELAHLCAIGAVQPAGATVEQQPHVAK